MLKLKDITLILVTSVDIEASIMALEYSCKEINFGAVKFISDKKPKYLPNPITHEYIDPITNIDEWNYAIIYKLSNYVKTPYAILIHADGYIVNPSSWTDEFYKYDYIGAPWPIPNDDFSYRDINGDLIRVGNSVSFRSKRLIDLPVKLNLEWKSFHGYYNEDGFITVNYRHIYLQHDMKFADMDVAIKFSHETMIPEVINYVNAGNKPFAFHRHSGSNTQYPKFK